MYYIAVAEHDDGFEVKSRLYDATTPSEAEAEAWAEWPDRYPTENIIITVEETPGP